MDLLTTHRKRQAYQFLLHSYLIGVSSYGLLLFIVFLNNKILEINDKTPTWEVTFLKSLLNSKENIKVSEVFFATMIGIVLAIILVVIINKKYIYKLANHLNISNKHGEDDVWDFLFGSNDVEWVTVRDPESKLVYQGAVSSYSQKDDKRELILSQVKVYKDKDDDDLKELYEKDFIYLSFDVCSKIIVEID
ncbi:hypothetical protein [Bacillus mesophilum]|uniref:Uncharacterized protein n=1 Tax=Bacillus mesophilum TaxID=1071718 RepID=A0A7V7RP92_9BACI|nr:hypothetical protein F7732_00405 [Bacillus mesophilum]